MRPILLAGHERALTQIKYVLLVVQGEEEKQKQKQSSVLPFFAPAPPHSFV